MGRFLLVLATLSLIACSPDQRQEATVDDEQAIRDWYARWKVASDGGDLQGVLACYAEDAIFMFPGGMTMGREPFAEGVTNSPEKERDYIFEGGSTIEEIKVFGDHAYLWLTSDFAITVKASDSKTRYKGHSLAILEKRDGKWLLIRDVNNVVPETE